MNNAVVHDTFDAMTWATLCEGSELVETARSIAAQTPTGERALEDLFHLFYLADPQVVAATRMAPGYRHNRELMAQLARSEEVADLRKHTKLDAYQSGCALLAIEQTLREALEDGTNAVLEAARQAGEEIAAADLALRHHGIDPSRVDFDRRRDLTRRLQTRKLADLVGAFRAVEKAAHRRRVKHEPAEVYDYVLGEDLNRLVAEEITNLAVPELEDQFWLRRMQHGLLLRQVRGPGRAGRGPIIVVCDESVSMNTELDVDDNTREAWSKAVALAMCEQARRQHRDFTYIGFCMVVEYEAHFPKGRASFEEVVEFVEHFAGGNTDFGPALERALTLITESERRHEDKPDVVFITDGTGEVTEEFLGRWRTALRRLDVACYAVQVGSDVPGGGVHPTLGLLTDKVLHIEKRNATPDGVADLFLSM